jgi:hypothetical protein
MVWALFNQDQHVASEEIAYFEKSDRVAAVIGGAMLDDSLRTALEARLRPKDGKTDMNEKLFKVSGPLGNLGPKVDLAYQLYMVDKNVRNTMYGISEIRNLFAHNLRMTFSSSSDRLSASIKKLVMHEGKTKYPHPFRDEDSEYDIGAIETRHDRFIVNLKLCLIHLIRDGDIHMPNSCLPINYRRRWTPLSDGGRVDA